MDTNPKELLAHIRQLPPLSAPLEQILDLLNRNQSNWAHIAKVMLKDPILTGRVLQVANSSFYGLPRQVTDIEIACTMLGTETLRSLVYTLILLAEFRHGKEGSCIDYDLLWKHSLRVACLIKKIAQKSYLESATAFTVGLFHCLDLIIQDYFFREKLIDRIVKYQQQTQQKDKKIHTMIDTEFWWLSAALLEHWQFPPIIVSIFRNEKSTIENKFRTLILAGDEIVKSLDDEKIISANQQANINNIFLCNDIPLIDLQECLDKSENLYCEMMVYMFN